MAEVLNQSLMPALGVLFIIVYASDRFNTPFTNRASTTAIRYYTAMLFYWMVGLTLYAVLVRWPDLAARILGQAGDLPQWASDLESPLLVALMLTVLLPKLPLLSSVDDWIRRRLQYMAAIPHEARRLSAELRRAPFQAPDGLRVRVGEDLTNAGIAPADVVFDGGRGPQQRLTRIAVLMRALEDWEGERRFAGFFARFADDYAALGKRYRQLLPKARTCFALLREAVPTEVDRGRRDPVNEFRREFEDQAQEVLHSVYDFVSRAVLQCSLTYRTRNQELRTLGFVAQVRPPRLSLNQLMTVFLGTALLVVVGTVAVQQLSGRPDAARVLTRTVMVGFTCMLAVWCAIYPRDRLAIARIGADGLRPVAFYLVAGVLAALLTRPVAFAAQVLLQGSVGDAWARFTTAYPWMLLPFVTAVTTAALIDNRVTARLTRTRLRLLEGLGQAAALVATSWLIQQWLAGLRPDRGEPDPLAWAIRLGMHGAIGFVIGFLVPTWYREAPRRMDEGLGTQPGAVPAPDVVARLAA